ncbi:MAG: PEP/pyruvate-binding domain-containing protein [Patescibacteria group bacterium]
MSRKQINSSVGFIKNFSNISKSSVNEAGGKGASLGEMANAKIPVPPGFVILANAFERFLEETDLVQEIAAQLKKVNYKDINSVDRYSNVIRDLIADAPMPEDLGKEIITEFKKLKAPFVAVRSSATAEDSSTASWAGELETYLNTTDKTLLVNVKKCWSSLFTPRAIFYRQEKKLLKAQVSVAVVVQKMIDSEISGIAFTVHPVTQDRNQMIIEAGYGLGEAIVSGSITPDSYVIGKRDYSLIDINIAAQARQIIKGAGGGTKWVKIPKTKGEKQKLGGKQILELAKICVGIEKHYKFPCDIEWAYAKGKFYITQSRPITTL